MKFINFYLLGTILDSKDLLPALKKFPTMEEVQL